MRKLRSPTASRLKYRNNATTLKWSFTRLKRQKKRLLQHRRRHKQQKIQNWPARNDLPLNLLTKIRKRPRQHQFSKLQSLIQFSLRQSQQQPRRLLPERHLLRRRRLLNHNKLSQLLPLQYLQQWKSLLQRRPLPKRLHQLNQLLLPRKFKRLKPLRSQLQKLKLYRSLLSLLLQSKKSNLSK